MCTCLHEWEYTHQVHMDFQFYNPQFLVMFVPLVVYPCSHQWEYTHQVHVDSQFCNAHFLAMFVPLVVYPCPHQCEYTNQVNTCTPGFTHYIIKDDLKSKGLARKLQAVPLRAFIEWIEIMNQNNIKLHGNDGCVAEHHSIRTTAATQKQLFLLLKHSKKGKLLTSINTHVKGNKKAATLVMFTHPARISIAALLTVQLRAQ